MKMRSLKKIIASNNNFFARDLSKDKNLEQLKLTLKKIKHVDVVIHCMGGGFGIKDDLI